MEAELIKADQPKRKRRWFLITPDRLVVGLLAVTKIGATVTYWINVEPEPAWLRAILGDDFFHNVVQVDVKTDTGLAKVDALSHLKTLDLSYRQVTDTGLEHLAGLSRLEHLDLWYTPITDDGVGHLSGLSQLQWLDLSHTKITDTALKHIARLSELRLLNLSTNTITDTGLKQLYGLTHLQTLKLYGTLVTLKASRVSSERCRTVRFSVSSSRPRWVAESEPHDALRPMN